MVANAALRRRGCARGIAVRTGLARLRRGGVEHEAHLHRRSRRDTTCDLMRKLCDAPLDQVFHCPRWH